MNSCILGNYESSPFRGIMSSIYFFKVDSEEIENTSLLIKNICYMSSLSNFLYQSPSKIKHFFPHKKEQNYFNFLSKIFLYINPFFTPQKNIEGIGVYRSADNKKGVPYPVTQRECEVISQRNVSEIFFDCGHFTMIFKFLFNLAEVNTLNSLSKEDMLEEALKLVYSTLLSQSQRVQQVVQDKLAWNGLQFCLRRICKNFIPSIHAYSALWSLVCHLLDYYPSQLDDFLDRFLLNFDTLHLSSECIIKNISMLVGISDHHLIDVKHPKSVTKPLELFKVNSPEFVLRKLLELLKYYTYKDKKKALSHLEESIFNTAKNQLENVYSMLVEFLRTDQKMASPRLINSLLKIIIMLYKDSEAVFERIIKKEIEVHHRFQLLERIFYIIDFINLIHSNLEEKIVKYLCLNPKLRFDWKKADTSVFDQIISSSLLLLFKFDWALLRISTLKLNLKTSKKSRFLSCIFNICSVRNSIDSDPSEILQELFSVKSNKPYLASSSYSFFIENIFRKTTPSLDPADATKKKDKQNPISIISQPLLLKILLSNLEKFTRIILEKFIKDLFTFVTNDKNFLPSLEKCLSLDYVVLEIIQACDEQIVGCVKLLGYIIRFLGEKKDWKTLRKIIKGQKKASILSLELLHHCLEEIYQYSHESHYNKKGFKLAFLAACVLEEVCSQKNERVLTSVQFLVCTARILVIFHRFNTLYISSPYFCLEISQEPLKHRKIKAIPKGGVIRIMLKLLLNGIKY